MNAQRLLCPRCNQQGQIMRMRIAHSNEEIQLCDECDAMWPRDSEVTSETFVDFGTHMRSIGRKGLWSELEEVDE